MIIFQAQSTIRGELGVLTKGGRERRCWKVRGEGRKKEGEEGERSRGFDKGRPRGEVPESERGREKERGRRRRKRTKIILESGRARAESKTEELLSPSNPWSIGCRQWELRQHDKPQTRPRIIDRRTHLSNLCLLFARYLLFIPVPHPPSLRFKYGELFSSSVQNNGLPVPTHHNSLCVTPLTSYIVQKVRRQLFSFQSACNKSQGERVKEIR